MAFGAPASAWMEPPSVPEVVDWSESCRRNDLAACAELALAERTGATARSGRRWRRQLAERACAGGVALGCAEVAALEVAKRPSAAWTLAQGAFDGGEARAALILGELDPVRALPSLRSACAQGVAAACALVAVHDDEEASVWAVDHACRLGAAPACVDQALREGPGAVDALCAAGEPLACREADWLATGGAAVPLKMVDHTQRYRMFLLETVIPFVRPCLREAISEQPELRGPQPIDGWVAADGTLGGLRVVGDPRGPLSTCLAEGARGLRVLRAQDTPGTFAIEVGVDHRATTEVTPLHTYEDSPPVLALRRWAAQAWSTEMERCFLEGGGHPDDRVFAMLDVHITMRNELRRVAWVETTGLDEVDRCLASTIEAHPPPRVATRWEAPAPVRLRVDFVQLSVQRPAWAVVEPLSDQVAATPAR